MDNVLGRFLQREKRSSLSPISLWRFDGGHILIFHGFLMFIYLFISINNIKEENLFHVMKNYKSDKKESNIFYYMPTVSRVGEAVNFYIVGKKEIGDNFIWNFGDGSISEEVDPVHIYEKPNLYKVSLKINKGGAIKETSKNILVVANKNDKLNKPIADFYYYPPNPKIGSAIRFYDLSSGNISKRLWQFGLFNFSMLNEPVKTFYSSGKYAISLFIQGPYGSDSVTKYIEVSSEERKIIISKSCELKHVQAAIAEANPGDTVIVPNGEATWPQQLIIKKGVILKAAAKAG